MVLDFTIYNTYEVADGTIRVIHTPTTPISEYIGRYVYAIIRTNALDQYTINLAMMLTHEQNIDTSQTLMAFLTERLTHQSISRYMADHLPVPSRETQKYVRRVVLYDAEAETDCRMAYTSVKTPEIRNDIHMLESLPDVVISHARRSLANSLVSINGVFHATRYHDHELYALDGNTNVQNCRRSDVVIVDTTDVGGHTCIPITATRYKNTAKQDPRQGVYLDVPSHFDLTRGTPLLVIDGTMHPIDGTYEVVSKHRIKIRTNAMDLVHEFLHNPNTKCTHDKDGRNISPYLPVETPVLEKPSVVDRITQYLTTLDQFPKRPTTPTYVDALIEYRPKPLYKDAPDAVEKITYAFEHMTAFTLERRGAARTALVYMPYNKIYRAATDIAAVIPTTSLTSAEFVLSRVFSKHSFIVLIHNTNLYRNVMPIQQIDARHGYEKLGYDCPRGLPMYNRHLTVPYRVLAGQSGQYSVAITAEEPNRDLYKTSLAPLVVASPYYDQTDHTQQRRVEFVELFTA